jgi:hypothetical protein
MEGFSVQESGMMIAVQIIGQEGHVFNRQIDKLRCSLRTTGACNIVPSAE